MISGLMKVTSECIYLLTPCLVRVCNLPTPIKVERRSEKGRDGKVQQFAPRPGFQGKFTFSTAGTVLRREHVSLTPLTARSVQDVYKGTAKRQATALREEYLVNGAELSVVEGLHLACSGDHLRKV